MKILIFGYARVSTWGQDLDSQMIALKRVGCEKIYTEKFTGTKLDRFARSTIQGVETVQHLFKREINVHILNMGVIENTPTGRLTFTIFSAFAEFERDMIVERTKEGKALAKLSPDFREGRPKKFSKDQLDLAMDLLKNDTTKNVSRKTGISEASLYREKRRRKYQN